MGPPRPARTVAGSRPPSCAPAPLNAPPANAVNIRRLRLERQAIALSRRCPQTGANPPHCPLFGLRPLSLRERRAWLRGLTLEELEYLETYHVGCAAEKLSDPHVD